MQNATWKTLALAGVVTLSGTAAWAECYGGRGPDGQWACTCDEGTNSGLSAMIMGGYTHIERMTDLAACQSWANGKNGVTAATPAAGSGNAEPKTEETIVGDLCMADYQQCTSSGQSRPACVSVYNQCSEAQIENTRQEAVASGWLTPEQAETLRVASVPAAPAPMQPEPAEEVAAPPTAPVTITTPPPAAPEAAPEPAEAPAEPAAAPRKKPGRGSRS